MQISSSYHPLNGIGVHTEISQFTSPNKHSPSIPPTTLASNTAITFPSWLNTAQADTSTPYLILTLMTLTSPNARLPTSPSTDQLTGSPYQPTLMRLTFFLPCRLPRGTKSRSLWSIPALPHIPIQHPLFWYCLSIWRPYLHQILCLLPSSPIFRGIFGRHPSLTWQIPRVHLVLWHLLWKSNWKISPWWHVTSALNFSLRVWPHHH